MRRLDLQQHHVDETAVTVTHEIEICAEAEHGKQVQCLFGGQDVRVTQDSVGAAHLILQHGVMVFFELGTGILLRAHDAFDDFFDLRDDLRLRLAQRVLVGDLEEITQSLGALTVEAAHSQADLADGLDNGIDLLGQNERRQMQHHRGTHAGAEIRRAGGQVTEFRIKGERQTAFQLAVHAVHEFIGTVEVQTGADALNAEVILLIDHDGNALLTIHDDRAARRARRMLAADEMALHEHLFADLAQVSVVLAVAVAHLRQLLDHGAHLFEEVHALSLLAKTRKRKAAQITRQTHTRGHDDLGMRSRSFHPVGGIFNQCGKTHHLEGALGCSRSISAFSFAASS